MSDTPKLTLNQILTPSGILVRALWILAFAAATALAARIEVPVQPVPFTLQTLVVLLAGAFLGARNGAISQGVYLLVGVLGAPVFSSGGFGIMKLIGPTGGYLIAFPIAAAVAGYLVSSRARFVHTLAAMAAGLLVIFVSGTLHLYAFYVKDISAALQSGFLIFTWWDVIKLFAAAATYHELAKRWPRLT